MYKLGKLTAILWALAVPFMILPQTAASVTAQNPPDSDNLEITDKCTVIPETATIAFFSVCAGGLCVSGKKKKR